MCTSRCQKVKRIGSREHTGSQDRRVSVSSPERKQLPNYQWLWNKIFEPTSVPLIISWYHLMVETIQERSTYGLCFCVKMRGSLIWICQISSYKCHLAVEDHFLARLYSHVGHHGIINPRRTARLDWKIQSASQTKDCDLNLEQFVFWKCVWYDFLLLPMRECLLIWYAGLFMSKHFPTTGKVCCHIYTLLRRTMKQ